MREMFIIKGIDFTLECESLDINYWEVDNSGESLESETVTPEELDALMEAFDTEGYTINDTKFKWVSYESGVCKLICEHLTYEDIKDYVNGATLCDEKFDLPIKIVRLGFKDFKTMFNLKGTKAQLVNNVPEGFELQSLTNGKHNTHHTLYTTIERDFKYFQYECNIGRIN